MHGGVFAVIRTSEPTYALTIGRGLAGTSVAAIEITMTVPDAPRVIAALVAEGVTRVGAGTVRTVEQVESCHRAGATFIVSPHLDRAIVQASLHRGLAVVPGVMTPSEIMTALDLGATAAKVFPIQTVGGLTFVEAVLEPLPDVRLVASGGLLPEEVPRYLDAGAYGACLGDALWHWPDVAEGDVESVQRSASAVLADIDRARATTTAAL
jgi:2-dehydro-3-deoxyphosphogluconate aldolase/(4S)-4-hydroxy-2-oxoglutarate aldolase